MCVNLSGLGNVMKNVSNMMLKAVRKLNKHITTFDRLLTSTTCDNKRKKNSLVQFSKLNINIKGQSIIHRTLCPSTTARILVDCYFNVGHDTTGQ